MVAGENEINSIKTIRFQSSILNELENQNEIAIIGAMYCVRTGIVTFFE